MPKFIVYDGGRPTVLQPVILSSLRSCSAFILALLTDTTTPQQLIFRLQLRSQGTPTSMSLEPSCGMFSRRVAKMPTTSHLLSSAEALTMPAVQVIVLNANMRCHDCRERVSKLLSKMDNLLEYVVDVVHKKVTVRGTVDPKKRMKRLLNEKRGLNNLQFEGYSKHKDLEQPHKSKCNASSHNLINGSCSFR
ncbi:hypothetical protein SUGI_0855380 [Cryptomeria japonica]|uniref:uncharacterized protein LOC131055376 n=1 Tax=Cryptomeria japonica TaxID=3369 RepID=UPI0024149632|nr:uncharacterized protein LOC131055376 [Cryptomeria japonica]GLJ41327.1 hypothetical protein SUGI_0855380 [Cryptomeria japonica]